MWPLHTLNRQCTDKKKRTIWGSLYMRWTLAAWYTKSKMGVWYTSEISSRLWEWVGGGFATPRSSWMSLMRLMVGGEGDSACKQRHQTLSTSRRLPQLHVGSERAQYTHVQSVLMAPSCSNQRGLLEAVLELAVASCCCSTIRGAAELAGAA